MPVPIKLKFKHRDVNFRYKSQKSPGGNAGHNKRTKVSANAKKALPPQVQKILWLQANGRKRFVTTEELEQLQAEHNTGS